MVSTGNKGYQKGVLDIEYLVVGNYVAMEGVIGGSSYSFLFPAQLIVVLETYVGDKSCVMLPTKTYVNRIEDCAPKWLTFFHHTNLVSVFSPQSM